MPIKIVQNSRRLEVYTGRRLGMRVTQLLCHCDQFGEVFWVVAEMLFIGAVIDLFQRLLLQHEDPLHFIAYRPIALTIQTAPLALSRRSLLHTSGATNPFLDDLPAHLVPFACEGKSSL